MLLKSVSIDTVCKNGVRWEWKDWVKKSESEFKVSEFLHISNFLLYVKFGCECNCLCSGDSPYGKTCNCIYHGPLSTSVAPSQIIHLLYDDGEHFRPLVPGIPLFLTPNTRKDCSPLKSMWNFLPKIPKGEYSSRSSKRLNPMSWTNRVRNIIFILLEKLEFFFFSGHANMRHLLRTN